MKPNTGFASTLTYLGLLVANVGGVLRTATLSVNCHVESPRGARLPRSRPASEYSSTKGDCDVHCEPERCTMLSVR